MKTKTGKTHNFEGQKCLELCQDQPHVKEKKTPNNRPTLLFKNSSTFSTRRKPVTDLFKVKVH